VGRVLLAFLKKKKLPSPMFLGLSAKKNATNNYGFKNKPQVSMPQ
jgi:hypothetical protein